MENRIDLRNHHMGIQMENNRNRFAEILVLGVLGFLLSVMSWLGPFLIALRLILQLEVGCYLALSCVSD